MGRGTVRGAGPGLPSGHARPRLTAPVLPGLLAQPLRGLRFTAVLGLVLLVGITVLFVTGLLSYAAYNPDLDPVNDKTPDKGILGFYLFAWPTDPDWLYRLTQGVHVTLGLTLIPVLGRSWSVVPRLFTLPPARSLTHALERISLLLLVGGALFTFLTGVLQHPAGLRLPRLLLPAALLRGLGLLRRVRRARRAQGAGGAAQPPGDARGARRPGLPAPDPPHRLAARGAVAGGRRLAADVRHERRPQLRRAAAGDGRALAARRARTGERPQRLPDQQDGRLRGHRPGRDERGRLALVVTGRTGTVRLGRAELRRLEQHSAALPIACVEGWSTSDQWWRGVRLRDLAALVGFEDDPPDVFAESLQRRGAFRSGALRANQWPTRAPCSPWTSTARR